MEQTAFFVCNLKKGDRVFLTHLVRENDLIISTSPLPPTLDLQLRRTNAHIIQLTGGFKDLLADEQAEEFERDLRRILSSITTERISCTIILRDFDQQAFYSFYLISLLSQVPTLKIEKTSLNWIKEHRERERLIIYELRPFERKAELEGFNENELIKANAILLASSVFPVYPRLLASSWSEPTMVEAERRRVCKILKKLNDQGLIERAEQYVDYFGKAKIRLTSVRVHAYKITMKGRATLASMGDVEREEANLLAEPVYQIIRKKNLYPRDIWVEGIIPYCPVYNEGLRNRLIISSNGHNAVPVKPEYLNPRWYNCSFILIDVQKQPFELKQKEFTSLISKLGRMSVDDLRLIYDRRKEQGISGPFAFPMSARPWLDDPERVGGPLKELVDRLGFIFNLCTFLQNDVCLVQTPISQWGFEPTEDQQKIYDLYEKKKKYNL